MADNNEGRPPVSEEEKKLMLSKLEPYLKSGLSVRKALVETKISNATFYRLMDRDEEFREQIHQYKQFLSVLYNNAIVKELQDIITKQNPKDGAPKEPLEKEEIDFLKWFGLNSNLTKEEYGERKDLSIYDPEVEIQRLARLMDEETGDEEHT